MAERSRGRCGVGALRILVEGREPALTRSEAEERLLDLLRRGGLPSPRTNARVDRYEVDVLWPAERVIVEVDGFAFHGSRSRFEEDRTRDARLVSRGYRVVRVTWRQISEQPEAVLVHVAGVLASAKAS